MNPPDKYVALDTNIILLDANNLFAFPDKTLLISSTVIDELDNKKSDLGELGYQAREFGRIIAKSKLMYTNQTEEYTSTVFYINPIESNPIEIHIVELKEYPEYKDTSPNIVNDRKIIEVAKRFNAEFISNDVMARIRAAAEGLEVREFRIVDNKDYEFTKFIDVPAEEFSLLHRKAILEVDPKYIHENYNYVFRCDELGQTKLGTIENGSISIIGKDSEQELRRQDINPMNVEQLFLSRHLQDPTVNLVVVESLAGSGKTAVAISNGLRMVRQGHYEGLLYVRSSQNDVDSSEEVGFLSTNEAKFAVYLHPLEDTLDYIVRQKLSQSKLKGEELELKVAEETLALKAKHNIQAMTTLGMRGRTFNNFYVIIDECQNLSHAQTVKLLTRIGKNCKVVLTGSNRQIDNKWISKYTNGLGVLLDACKRPNEHIKIAAVTLQKVVRSPMAEWAEKLFDATSKSS